MLAGKRQNFRGRSFAHILAGQFERKKNLK
jgi:hypothetical protein